MELEELRRLAAKEELSLNYIAKDEMISKAVLGLQGHEDIILKGGTAINRVCLKNKRFSEDIDLDIVFKGNVKQALPRTREIAGRLKEFQIAKPRIMKNTIRYDLFYTNPLDHKDKIRLEFAITKKAADYGRKIVNFGFVPCESALLNVYDIEWLIIDKINCILNRKEGKDLFDLCYLLDLPHRPLNIPKKTREELVKRMSMGDKEIKMLSNTINHYLPKKQRPSWGMLLEELKTKILKEF